MNTDQLFSMCVWLGTVWNVELVKVDQSALKFLPVRQCHKAAVGLADHPPEPQLEKKKVMSHF